MLTSVSFFLFLFPWKQENLTCSNTLLYEEKGNSDFSEFLLSHLITDLTFSTGQALSSV